MHLDLSLLLLTQCLHTNTLFPLNLGYVIVYTETECISKGHIYNLQMKFACLWGFCGSFLLFVFVVFSCLFIVVFLDTCWERAGMARKGLTSWLSCVSCFIVHLLLSHVVFWVRCGA